MNSDDSGKIFVLSVKATIGPVSGVWDKSNSNTVSYVSHSSSSM